VKLVSLSATNFKRLNFDSPLKFKPGVTVISGLNEAGKSTILDAVLYALFGRVTRPPGHVKDEDLLAYQAKRSVVILEFEIGEEFYRVEREISRTGTNRARLYKRVRDGGWRELAAKSRDVTGMVEDLLGGISFEEMLSSNVVAQKDLGRLVDSKTDRWKVINAFLHLESFTEVSKELNDEKNDLEGTGGPLRPGTINTAKDELMRLKQISDEFHKRSKENAELDGEIKSITKENATLEAEYSKLQDLEGTLRDYDETVRKKGELTREANSKQELLDNHRKSVSSLEPKVHALEAELVQYRGMPSNEEVGRVSFALESADRAARKVAQAKQTAESKENEVEQLENEVGGFDPEVLKNLERKRSPKLPAAGLLVASIGAAASYFFAFPIVPWVLAAAGAVFAALLARTISSMSGIVSLQEKGAKYRRYRDAQVELTDLQGKLETAEKEQVQKEGELERAIASIPYYRSLTREGTPIEKAMALVKKHSEDSTAFSTKDDSLDKMKRSLEDLRGQLDEEKTAREIENCWHEATRLSLPSLPDGLVFSKGLMMSTSKNKEDVRGKISTNEEKVRSDKKAIIENQEFLSENEGIDGRLAHQEALVGKLERQLLVTKLAKEGVEQTAEAIKARFKPGVQRHMGEILPSLTQGRYRMALLDEDFGVKVFDQEAGEYRPRDVFSGGTDDQFLLAMRLAFVLSLIPEAKGIRPDFLWLDEPLGSSDELRRLGIIEYLSTGLSKSFTQIFIVSHVGGLEEMTPSVIRLENGKSVGGLDRDP
jgi:exonuclease SbcC